MYLTQQQFVVSWFQGLQICSASKACKHVSIQTTRDWCKLTIYFAFSHYTFHSIAWLCLRPKMRAVLQFSASSIHK